MKLKLHSSNQPAIISRVASFLAPTNTERTQMDPPSASLHSFMALFARRKAYGLPADLSRAVFANFNKLDKLEPESFSLWMRILRRVPGSTLWLLNARAVEAEVGLRYFSTNACTILGQHLAEGPGI